MIEIPPRIERLLADVERRQRKREEEWKDRFDRHITSDFEAVWELMQALPERRGLFLEWGSGMGAISMMATHLGFDAYGIEIDEPLVTVAEELAQEHGFDATYIVGSFFPERTEDDPSLLDLDCVHDPVSDDAYQRLGMEPSDFDCIYAFPWPGEEDLLLDLFHRIARPGALLLFNRGHEGMELLRNEWPRRPVLLTR